MTAIAITGMACLFPGAPDVDTYWRNILAGVDSVTDPPPEAWDPDVYHDPDFVNEDATYTKRGGYLGSLAHFEPLDHGIPPASVGGEPDQWLALRVARDALADAGALDLPEDVRRRTNIILGKGTYLNGGNAIAVQRGLVIGQTIDLLRRLHPEHGEEDLELIRREMQRVLPRLDADTVPGLIPNVIVGRIANRLDLMGPAYTVDAACASSLVAVEHAVRDLASGTCDVALAGGSQVWMPVATLNLFCRLGALSRRQGLRPFSRGADGTLLGEGIGMVVLKRAEDAERDGDRVYALIRGVGVSSDGRATGVMAPRVEGEELALRRAYEAAGVDPRTVGMIEAHGTGTPVGDAAEVEALTRVLGERVAGEPARVALGTVKSMISHTIPAAGVAGIIKTALALHHRVLPPTLCDEPNPDLGLERSPLYLNTEARPWVHGGTEPRRAGVNAFGFGGINAHAVLEETGDAAGAAHRAPWDTELFLLEAGSAAELADAADELAAALEAGPSYALADLAYTLGLGLGDGPLRLGIVAGSFAELREKLTQAAAKLRAGTKRIRATSGIHFAAEPLGRSGGVAVVFPGEGAQYPGMLAELAREFEDVRSTFDRVDRLYAGHPRGDLLSDWVFPPPAFDEAERARTEARLNDLDIAVESVLTANGALFALLSRILRRVDAVVGHSTGEHSAALVSGVLDVDTDAGLVAFSQGLYRAYAGATERHDLPGAVLLALGAGREVAAEIAGQAGGELHLAMDNCPHQVVLVGEAAPVARARDLAAARGIVCEVLPYDRAVHTPLFAPFAEDLRAVFDALPVGTATLPLWSCTTAARYPTDEAGVRDLLVEHWTSPVRFRETIEALHEEGVRIFVECGPRGNMTAFVEDVLRGKPSCAVALDARRRSGVTQLNHAVAQLAVHGVDVDVAPLWAERDVREVDWRAAEPPAKPVLRVALNTTWPMLRLSDEVIARVRRPAAPAPAAVPAANGIAPAVAAPAANGMVPAAAAPAANGMAPAAAAPAVATMAPAVAAPAPMPPASTEDEDAAVVEAHLRTMERFLETTRDVVGAALAPVPGPCVLHRVLDPAADRFLRDHTLGRGVSVTDPDLRGLPLLPLAMSLEFLAEAALEAAGGGVVTGLRDVRAYRWIAFGDAAEALELQATPVEPGAVEVRLLQQGAVRVEGRVLVAGAHPEPPLPLALDLAGAQAGQWAPGHLYDEVMFHGPSWQGVEAMDAVAPTGAQAQLRVLSTGDAPFVLDPVTLDAAGQVVGFWAAQTFDAARIVFPFAVAAVDVFGPPRPAGELLTCRAAIEKVGGSRTTADIDVLDSTGRPWLRLTGWEDRRFEVPERFLPLTAPTGMAPLSRPAGVPGARLLDARLPADGALWGPTWAHRVLSPAERAAFDALDRPEPRRLEWLGARTAAKEAVADLLGGGLLPADVEITADPDGRPRVAGRAVDVSLAHAEGRAAAIAATTGRVGIDLEPLRALAPGFADAGFRPEERAVIGGDDEWLLRAWCAKEAAGKAVGTGLSSGDARPLVTGIDRSSGDVTVVASGHELRVATRREDDLVLATTWWPGPDGGGP